MPGAVTERPMVAAPALYVNRLKDTWRAGLPYRHVVLDSFLDESLAKDLAGSFPHVDSTLWKHRTHLHSKKLTTEILPPAAQRAVNVLHSPGMLAWLEWLTGEQGLDRDPDLFGAGLHCSPRGGFLDIHADFSRHPVTGQQRVLNLLLYLNESWDPAWGGALEMWDAGVTQCLKKIEPVFNRAVIFETHATSFHGHPDPHTGPARKSLALYYYRPRTEWDVHVPTTDYHPRPQDYAKRLRKWIARRVK